MTDIRNFTNTLSLVAKSIMAKELANSAAVFADARAMGMIARPVDWEDLRQAFESARALAVAAGPLRGLSFINVFPAPPWWSPARTERSAEE